MGSNDNVYAAWHRTSEYPPDGVILWNGHLWLTVGTPNDYVEALAVDNSGSLYAGGSFTYVNSISAKSVARWDGSSWSSLGTGSANGTSYKVRALALDNSGNLYAGGDFITAGGNDAKYIARWDGANWYSLGSGMNDPVSALAVDKNGHLYVGGDFITAGGNDAKYIARWDGANWHPLGSGMNGPVSALAVDKNGHLYAGGTFTQAGGAEANRIARWDGNSWTNLGSGINGSVLALAFDLQGNLYAGGSFSTAGGKASSNIAEWFFQNKAIYLPLIFRSP